MKDVSYSNVICQFCGANRHIEYHMDDGIDYMGHHRGSGSSYTIDDGCNCQLGILEHNKVVIKEMCMNCKYYDSGYCTNKSNITNISSMFNISGRLEIKSVINKCDHYAINSNILLSLLKEE